MGRSSLKFFPKAGIAIPNLRTVLLQGPATIYGNAHLKTDTKKPPEWKVITYCLSCLPAALAAFAFLAFAGRETP
jgi:hypothetical protein